MSELCPACNGLGPRVDAVHVGNTEFKFELLDGAIVVNANCNASGQVCVTLYYGDLRDCVALAQPRVLIPGDILTIRGAEICPACAGEHTVQAAMRRKLEGKW